MQSILEWKAPRNVKDVQDVLGFANFYCWCIESYSCICKSMTDRKKTTDCTSGIRMFKGTRECDTAFAELKAAFTSAIILRHFNLTLQCIVETDTSDFAIGAVLSQVHSKKLHPMAFHS